jgi:hypothetical protein
MSRNQNFNNASVRPKRWMINGNRLVLGTGPYLVYRRLIGTQIGIVFRDTFCGQTQAFLLYYSLEHRDIRQVLRQLQAQLDPRDFAKIGVTQREVDITIPLPNIPNTPYPKRRSTHALQHLDWWKKTPGTQRNLEPNNQPTVRLYVN